MDNDGMLTQILAHPETLRAMERGEDVPQLYMGFEFMCDGKVCITFDANALGYLIRALRGVSAGEASAHIRAEQVLEALSAGLTMIDLLPEDYDL